MIRSRGKRPARRGQGLGKDDETEYPKRRQERRDGHDERFETGNDAREIGGAAAVAHVGPEDIVNLLA